jgi:DNA-directed RNA polymerase specialized sigma24 family protein
VEDFKTIVENHAQILFKIAKSYTRTTADFEDIYQELLIQLYASIKNFLGESKISIWIIIAYRENNDFDVEYAVQLALLHDTLEDTETEYTELAEKFGKRIAIGVQALTKNENPITKKAKMTDSLNRINALEKEVGMV